MMGALFYYQWHSVVNRLLVRVRRLQQPKYLASAVAGGMYFYWYIFRALRRSGSAAGFTFERREMVETLASLALLIMAALGWIIASSRAALAFTEAEVAFLFPAPIPRQTLIHFKLLRSQTTILISAVVMTIIGRSWGTGNAAIRLIGWWLVFSTLNLHLMGASFVLTRLTDRGLSNRWRRIGFLLVGAVGVGGLLLWAYFVAPRPPHLEGMTDPHWLTAYAAQLLHAGPLPWLLYPFRLVVAPYFAVGARQFFMALGPALAILGLHYWWVIRSNVSFEEASVELSQKTAARLAAVRQGQWAGPVAKKAKRPPFPLQPIGRPAVALFWKNLISAGSFATTRFWLFLLWIVVFGGMFLHSKAKTSGGIGEAVSFMVMGLIGMSLFMAPQMLRNDLRQDLPVTDVLKMFPMRGWQVVLGEVLAPTAIMAAVQWLLLLVGVFLFPDHVDHHPVSVLMRMGFAAGAAILLPLIDFIAMLIPNAAVMFLPAWFQLGKEGPRSFEATGQRLILMFGQLFALLVSLLPAAFIVSVIVFLGFRFLPREALGIVIFGGSVAGSVILAVELWIAVRLLGQVFERFDLSSEVLDLQ